MIEATDIRKSERSENGEDNGYSLHSLVLQPFYDEAGITIYCGDNRKIVSQLEDCDLLLTDPPYGLNVLKTGKIGTGGKEWGKSDWDSATPDRWMMELVRAKTRWQIIWGGNYYELPPTRAWIIWNKMQRDFSFADGEMAWSNLDAAVRIMDYSRAQLLAEGKQHPTQKPLPLMSWCLNQVPEAKTVLDPWMGSGTTLVAAKERGLRAIGIEQNEAYCRVAVSRLAQGVLGLENE